MKLDMDLSREPGAILYLLAIRIGLQEPFKLSVDAERSHWSTVLLQRGLITRTNPPTRMWKCTPRGEAFVAMLTATPLPTVESVWRDPRTKEVIHLEQQPSKMPARKHHPALDADDDL